VCCQTRRSLLFAVERSLQFRGEVFVLLVERRVELSERLSWKILVIFSTAAPRAGLESMIGFGLSGDS